MSTPNACERGCYSPCLRSVGVNLPTSQPRESSNFKLNHHPRLGSGPLWIFLKVGFQIKLRHGLTSSRVLTTFAVHAR